jgi:hypothetical protein
VKTIRALPLLILAATIAFAACSDDPTDTDPADSVAQLRLAIGAQTITINQGGAITGGPVTIPAAGATITATFLDAGSQPVVIPTTQFQLNVILDGSGRLTFTRTGPFAGTLTRVSAGAASLSVSLFHTGAQHDDFGPFVVPVTVQ